MDTPEPPELPPNQPPSAAELERTWESLRDDLMQLNGQLEYLRLLLRLGVRPF